MYYLLLTIFIIIVFILHKKYDIFSKVPNISIFSIIISNLKLKLNRIKKKNNNNKKEHFIEGSLPYSNSNPIPSPITTHKQKKAYLSKNKINRKVRNNLKVLGKFISEKKEVELSLDLVYLDPKYHFENTTYLYGKKKTMENLEWKQEFTKSICQNDKGQCACYRLEDGEEICGVSKNDYIYECANPCSECTKCNLRRGKIQLQYQEYCNRAFNQQDKERCEKYKERVLLTKENCFFSENKNPKLVKNTDNCQIFLPARYNSYLVGEDIIFKVNLKYLTPQIRNMVDNIKIVDFRIENKITYVNEFYNSKDEIYLFLNTEDKYQGLNKLVKINGIIFFKDNIIPKIEFSNKNVVNIFSQPEIEEENTSSIIEEQNREDILNKKINTIFNTEIKKNIESVDADRFSNNYLGENKYFMCQKLNNYTVQNSIKQFKNGNFIPKKKLDNPYSWKKRSDINRPWDYILE